MNSSARNLSNSRSQSSFEEELLNITMFIPEKPADLNLNAGESLAVNSIKVTDKTLEEIQVKLQEKCKKILQRKLLDEILLILYSGSKLSHTLTTKFNHLLLKFPYSWASLIENFHPFDNIEAVIKAELSKYNNLHLVIIEVESAWEDFGGLLTEIRRKYEQSLDVYNEENIIFYFKNTYSEESTILEDFHKYCEEELGELANQYKSKSVVIFVQKTLIMHLNLDLDNLRVMYANTENQIIPEFFVKLWKKNIFPMMSLDFLKNFISAIDLNNLSIIEICRRISIFHHIYIVKHAELKDIGELFALQHRTMEEEVPDKKKNSKNKTNIVLTHESLNESHRSFKSALLLFKTIGTLIYDENGMWKRRLLEHLKNYNQINEQKVFPYMLEETQLATKEGILEFINKKKEILEQFQNTLDLSLLLAELNSIQELLENMSAPKNEPGDRIFRSRKDRLLAMVSASSTQGHTILEKSQQAEIRQKLEHIIRKIIKKFIIKHFEYFSYEKQELCIANYDEYSKHVVCDLIGSDIKFIQQINVKNKHNTSEEKRLISLNNFYKVIESKDEKINLNDAYHEYQTLCKAEGLSENEILYFFNHLIREFQLKGMLGHNQKKNLILPKFFFAKSFFRDTRSLQPEDFK